MSTDSQQATDPVPPASSERAVAMRTTTMQVNGTWRTVAAEHRRTLVSVLRHELALTGTKEVCAMGDCGACTVLIDDESTYSCLVLTAECDGHAIETIEGQARNGHLSTVQEAFIAADALQCGFCTPGQVLAVEAELRRRRDPADVPAWRTTGSWPPSLPSPPSCPSPPCHRSCGGATTRRVPLRGAARRGENAAERPARQHRHGSLAAVVILLFWLYLTAFVILLGAQLNAELERQTVRDSTVGPATPPGTRDAVAADDVASPPS